MPVKLKVLIITERFYPEEFIINDLAAEWAAGGMQVDVLTQAPSYPAGRIFPGYANALFSSENWKGSNIFRFFTVTGYRDSLFFKLLNYLNFAVTGTFAALFKARGYDRIFVYQTGPLGTNYLGGNAVLVNGGSITADLIGLFHWTISTNSARETNSIVDIGVHLLALDAAGQPFDFDGDAIPDAVENRSGSGTYDSSSGSGESLRHAA